MGVTLMLPYTAGADDTAAAAVETAGAAAFTPLGVGMYPLGHCDILAS